MIAQIALSTTFVALTYFNFDVVLFTFYLSTGKNYYDMAHHINKLWIMHKKYFAFKIMEYPHRQNIFLCFDDHPKRLFIENIKFVIYFLNNASVTVPYKK